MPPFVSALELKYRYAGEELPRYPLWLAVRSLGVIWTELQGSLPVALINHFDA